MPTIRSQNAPKSTFFQHPVRRSASSRRCSAFSAGCFKIRRSPRQERRSSASSNSVVAGLQYAVYALWSVSAQLKTFAIQLHQPQLPLADAIREEAHHHFMGQGFLALVDEKAT